MRSLRSFCVDEFSMLRGASMPFCRTARAAVIVLPSLVLGAHSALGADPPRKSPHDLCFASGNNTVTKTGLSVGASDASTSQVLELISQRRAEIALVCPEGYLREGALCRPIRIAVASASSAEEGNAKRSVSKSVQAEVRKGDPDQTRERSSTRTDTARNGAWGEVFADYEKHSSGGTQSQRSAGTVFGVDRTLTWGDTTLQVGVLGGYAHIEQRAAETKTLTGDRTYDVNVKSALAGGEPYIQPTIVKDLDFTLQSSTRQSLDGVTAGFSGSVSRGRLFADFVAKVDFFDITGRKVTSDSKGELKTIDGNSGGFLWDKFQAYDKNGTLISGNGLPGCIQVNEDLGSLPDDDARADAISKAYIIDPLSDSTSAQSNLRNYVLASNVGYHFDLGSQYWFEPIAGFRYTYSDYAGDAHVLGFKDGYALRLEAGGKVGKASVLQDGSVWTNSLGLFLYSDVIVDGFVIGTNGSSFDGDEGKLRVRGVLQSRIDLASGISAYGEVSGRVGEDYWGVGGKVGGRVEW